MHADRLLETFTFPLVCTVGMPVQTFAGQAGHSFQARVPGGVTNYYTYWYVLLRAGSDPGSYENLSYHRI